MRISKRFLVRLWISLLALIFCSCGGGGGDDASSGNACSDLNVRVFGGDQCRFELSPVVPLYALSAAGVPLGTCTGTMVTLDDILTAAHCIGLTQLPGSVGVFVYVNETLYPVVRGVNHPFYDGSVGSPYDVAMITFSNPVQIGPVPLLLSDPIRVGEQIAVFGYGKNERPENSPEDFRAAYMEVGAVNPFQFGATFNTTGTSVCQGDSGGPVTQTVDGVTSLVGVTSWTFNGCAEDSVSGFINVQNPDIYNFITAYAPDVAVR